MMKRCAVSLLLFVFAGACVTEPETQVTVQEAREAIPSSEYLKISVPESQGKTVGELSGAYVLTRGVTGIVNGGAAVILILARTITLFPPTSEEDGKWIWGPWGGNALQPAEYRMTVELQSDGDFKWTFEGRRKADGPSAAFQAFVTGIATPGQPGRGQGTFTIDFNVAEILDPVGNAGDGTLDADYNLESNPVTLTVNWMADGAAAAVEYRYAEMSDGSGDFQFTALADAEDPGPALEVVEMRSRWNATGAGRADARIASGDMPAELTATASECWDASAALVYYVDSEGWIPTVGDPASCAFSDAALPE